MTEKTCRKCLETKPLSEFNKEVKRIDGHASRCRLCIRDMYNKGKPSHDFNPNHPLALLLKLMPATRLERR